MFEAPELTKQLIKEAYGLNEPFRPSFAGELSPENAQVRNLVDRAAWILAYYGKEGFYNRGFVAGGKTNEYLFYKTKDIDILVDGENYSLKLRTEPYIDSVRWLVEDKMVRGWENPFTSGFFMEVRREEKENPRKILDFYNNFIEGPLRLHITAEQLPKVISTLATIEIGLVERQLG